MFLFVAFLAYQGVKNARWSLQEKTCLSWGSLMLDDDLCVINTNLHITDGIVDAIKITIIQTGYRKPINLRIMLASNICKTKDVPWRYITFKPVTRYSSWLSSYISNTVVGIALLRVVVGITRSFGSFTMKLTLTRYQNSTFREELLYNCVTVSFPTCIRQYIFDNGP